MGKSKCFGCDLFSTGLRNLTFFHCYFWFDFQTGHIIHLLQAHWSHMMDLVWIFPLHVSCPLRPRPCCWLLLRFIEHLKILSCGDTQEMLLMWTLKRKRFNFNWSEYIKPKYLEPMQQLNKPEWIKCAFIGSMQKSKGCSNCLYVFLCSCRLA